MRWLDWVYEKPYDFVRMIMKYCFGVEYKENTKKMKSKEIEIKEMLKETYDKKGQVILGLK